MLESILELFLIHLCLWAGERPFRGAKMQISAVLLDLHLNLDYIPLKASLNMISLFV